jgi:hypothetical protein
MSVYTTNQQVLQAAEIVKTLDEGDKWNFDVIERRIAEAPEGMQEFWNGMLVRTIVGDTVEVASLSNRLMNFLGLLVDYLIGVKEQGE